MKLIFYNKGKNKIHEKGGSMMDNLLSVICDENVRDKNG